MGRWGNLCWRAFFPKDTGTKLGPQRLQRGGQVTAGRKCSAKWVRGGWPLGEEAAVACLGWAGRRGVEATPPPCLGSKQLGVFMAVLLTTKRSFSTSRLPLCFPTLEGKELLPMTSQAGPSSHHQCSETPVTMQEAFDQLCVPGQGQRKPTKITATRAGHARNRPPTQR